MHSLDPHILGTFAYGHAVQLDDVFGPDTAFIPDDQTLVHEGKMPPTDGAAIESVDGSGVIDPLAPA